MIKFLHAADLHLDAPFSALSPEQAAARRQEQRALLTDLAEAANAQDCDVVLLAGDLFDSSSASEQTLLALRRALASIHAPVFISPGNHDCLLPGSAYLTESWPENVHIFKTDTIEAVELPEKNLRVYGAGFPAWFCPALLEGFAAKDDGRTNLMVVHGNPTQPSSPYNPILPAQIAQSGLSYLALGHIHQASGLLTAGGTAYAWPGCAMGRGFDELGQKGAYLGRITDAGVQLDFLPLPGRKYEILRVDAGDDALAAVKAALPERTQDDIYRVILTGEAAPVDLPALQAALAPRFYAVAVRDECELAGDKRAHKPYAVPLFEAVYVVSYPAKGSFQIFFGCDFDVVFVAVNVAYFPLCVFLNNAYIVVKLPFARRVRAEKSFTLDAYGSLHSAIVRSVHALYAVFDVDERVGERKKGESRSRLFCRFHHAFYKNVCDEGARSVVHDDEIAIVVHGAQRVFDCGGAAFRSVRECDARVFYARVFKRVEQLVAERGVYCDDDFRHAFRAEKWFYRFHEHARRFAGRKQLVFHAVALGQSARGDDHVYFHITLPFYDLRTSGKKRPSASFVLLNNAVHVFGALLGLTLVGGKHFEGHRIVAESDGDHVADFDFFCGFCGFAVYFDATAVAGFLRNRAPFDNSRYFQKLVYSHTQIILCKNGFFNSKSHFRRSWLARLSGGADVNPVAEAHKY